MLRLDRRALAVPFLFMSLSLPALADEPKGCDGFKWPLQTEASLLQSATKPVVLSGTTAVIDGKAFTLQLLDAGSAGLPKPPERAPRATPSMAGFAGFGPPAAAGSYQITLSAAAWIDIVQGGKYVKPSAFSGATDCPGVRKSIRVDLAASPFTLQISGLKDPSIGIVITPTPH
jgi:hypothetical protein